MYFRNSIHCKHRPELSKLETIWAEITLPNSKPFLICTAYRPPNATSSWIDPLEEELSAAQTTGLEIILMGDINIDLHICSNNKWLHLIQLFDLTQLVTDFTRITSSTATIIYRSYLFFQPARILLNALSHHMLNNLIKNLSSQTIVFIYSSRSTKALLPRLHPSPYRLRVLHLGHDFKSKHRKNFKTTEKSGTDYS